MALLNFFFFVWLLLAVFSHLLHSFFSSKMQPQPTPPPEPQPPAVAVNQEQPETYNPPPPKKLHTGEMTFNKATGVVEWA